MADGLLRLGSTSDHGLELLIGLAKIMAEGGREYGSTESFLPYDWGQPHRRQLDIPCLV